jgi:hypothetical protein
MTTPVGFSGAVPRHGFHAAMEMFRLTTDSRSGDDQNDTYWFMSLQPAWKPGAELPWGTVDLPKPISNSDYFTSRAYGGHVYAQASLAAARVVEEDDGEDKGAAKNATVRKFGIHVSVTSKTKTFPANVVISQCRAFFRMQDMWTGHSSTRYQELPRHGAFKPA